MNATATASTPSAIHDGHRKAAKDLVRAVGAERARELLQAWAEDDRRYLLVLQKIDETDQRLPTGALTW